MNIKLCLGLLVSGLSGCATMDATKASTYSTPELCRIAVLGAANAWVSIDSAGRLEAEKEALRRGVDCMQYAAQIRADHAEQVARTSAALGAAAQQLEDSGWQAAPAPAARTATSTSCHDLANGTTTCTTYYTSGPPQTSTCRTLSNGTTQCNH